MITWTIEANKTSNKQGIRRKFRRGASDLSPRDKKRSLFKHRPLWIVSNSLLVETRWLFDIQNFSMSNYQTTENFLISREFRGQLIEIIYTVRGSSNIYSIFSNYVKHFSEKCDLHRLTSEYKRRYLPALLDILVIFFNEILLESSIKVYQQFLH